MLELFFAGGSLGGRFGEIGLVDAAPHAVVGFVGAAGAAEHARERVVVGLRDGIELVIVATHAAERHAEESSADFADLLIDEVMLHLQFINGDDFDVTEHEKARRGDAVRRRRDEIAGDLFADELIEGFVVVEGADDVVAITPCMLGEDIVRRADLVRVAGEVEPVAGPALSEGGRGEEFVHDGLE